MVISIRDNPFTSALAFANAAAVASLLSTSFVDIFRPTDASYRSDELREAMQRLESEGNVENPTHSAHSANMTAKEVSA